MQPILKVGYTTTFKAKHAVKINGKLEPPHIRKWKLTITLRGLLHPNGIVCDFMKLKQITKEIIDPLKNADLNKIIENPTVENVMLWIYNKILEKIPPSVQIESIELSEGPFFARYEP